MTDDDAASLSSLADPFDAACAYLDTVSFPTSSEAYEFPFWELPPSNPYAGSVRAAGVRALKASPTEPEFLVSNLDHKFVVDPNEKAWAPLGFNKDALETREDLRSEIDFDSVLKLPNLRGKGILVTGPSGSGKTRLMCELLSQAFGLYISVASVAMRHSSVSLGSGDMEAFLDGLPASEEDKVAEISRRMGILVAVRAEVLRRVRKALPSLTATQWLHAQLSPSVLVPNADVFEKAFKAAVAAKGPFRNPNLVDDLIKQEGIPLLALDEVQRLENVMPVFASAADPKTKRTILSPIAKYLSSVKLNVVYAGTGLGVTSVIETLKSPLLQLSGGPYIVGVTTRLSAADVRAAVAKFGYPHALEECVAERFVGRPRFTTMLARSLIRQLSPSLVEKEALTQLEGMAEKLRAKNMETYLNFSHAAMEYILRGEPRLFVNETEAALEAGVGSMTRMQDTSVKFTIDEPLVVELFFNQRDILAGALRQSDSETGLIFEDYLATKVQAIADTLKRGVGGRAGAASVPEKFKGDWKVAEPPGSRVRGSRPSLGNEPASIAELVRAARLGRGKSIMFACNEFGPDLVFCAYDALSGRVLVMLIQCKATTSTSTPQAFKSLAYPYRQNRKGDHPVLPNERMNWASDLDAVLSRPDIVLVHAVFKTLEGSVAAAVEEHQYISALTGVAVNKPVLRLTFDTNTFETLGLSFAADLRQLEGVKRARWA